MTTRCTNATGAGIIGLVLLQNPNDTSASGALSKSGLFRSSAKGADFLTYLTAGLIAVYIVSCAVLSSSSL
eukprot:PRCOL_00006262-RA